MTYDPGIYHNISNEDYHASEGISSSHVKAWHKTTPLHAKCGKGGTIAQATADFGSAVHALVLEPHLDAVLSYDGTRRGNAWKSAHEHARVTGKYLLPEAECDRAYKCRDSLFNYPLIGDLLRHPNRICEASMFAYDFDRDLTLKARPDLYIAEKSLMVDVKTAARANPKDFSDQFFSFGYDLQAAYYLKVAELVGVSCKHFAFAVVEKEAPHAANLFTLEPEVIERASEVVEQCLDEIKADWGNPEPKTGWPPFTPISLPWWLKPENSKKGFS